MDIKMKKGDLLYRSKGIVEHAGVYLGGGLVLHNSPSNNVEVEGYKDFASGKAVKVVESNLIDHKGFDARLNHLLNSRKAYQLLSFNCENVASYLINGVSSSSQVSSATLGGLLGLVLGVNSDRSKLPYYMFIGASLGLFLENVTRKYA